jgi:hypothetical protein
MSVSHAPVTSTGGFSATLNEMPGSPHKLSVTGQIEGDYRVEGVSLVRASHQATPHILVLDLDLKLGPVENPHPEFIRLWPVEYTEDPARHRYTEVKIVSGSEHFTVEVVVTH